MNEILSVKDVWNFWGRNLSKVDFYIIFELLKISKTIEFLDLGNN